MGDKKYFSLPAAARELGVSADVLRQQFRTGRIPAMRTPGGQPRFNAETIEGIKQNGWPTVIVSGHGLAKGQSETCPPIASQNQFDDTLEPAQFDQEDLDFRATRSERPCLNREVHPPRAQLDLSHFYRKWISHARCLLPYWLTAEQIAEVSEQISREIQARTPEDEPLMLSFCQQVVRSILRPLNRQHELAEARDTALRRVLAKIPCDAIEGERTRIQALARTALQQFVEPVDSETLFSAACDAIAPVLQSIEFRRQREKLRAWAVQMTPPQANEVEQRELRTRIRSVLEPMKGQQDEEQIRDRLVEALEPVLAAIPKRLEEERRRKRVPALLNAAKLHVGTYLRTLYDRGELDYEAISDGQWRQELEGLVVAHLQSQLSGAETDEQVSETVERIVDDELEETADDEDEWE